MRGTEWALPCGPLWNPVHPRPCGEQSNSIITVLPCTGSSPPVRGTAIQADIPASTDRFIPARAGNSYGIKAAGLGTAVHPRPCGEQRKPGACLHVSSGSSPPVRGTVLINRKNSCIIRFIPARAGNSNIVIQRRCAQAVHPRPCGEQCDRLEANVSNFGSSPPVRGTAKTQPMPRALHRFIPARAGNSSLRSPPEHTEPVHPRPCGEQYQLKRDISGSSGSSPPVRGTEIKRRLMMLRLRFIPARAGNSPVARLQ